LNKAIAPLLAGGVRNEQQLYALPDIEVFEESDNVVPDLALTLTA